MSRPTSRTMDWLVVAVPAVPVLMLGLRPISDQDAFWHVLGGQHVWSTHDVVGPDPFGTFSTLAWVQHEWLGELIMAGFFAVGGFPGLATLVIALILSTFGVLLMTCRHEASLLVSALVGVVAMVGMSGSLGARPQLFSFLLLAVTHAAWRATARDRRARWWLVPLTWVWACVHGLWLAGILLGVAFVVGLALQRELDLWSWTRIALIPLASVAVAALTPVGPRLLVTPFTVNSYAYLVTEWDPPDVHVTPVAVTMALVALSAVWLMRSRTAVPWTDVMVWLNAFGWMVLYSRTVALAALLVAPLAARGLQSLLPQVRMTQPKQGWAIPGVLSLVLLIGAALSPLVATVPAGVPVGLSSRIDALPRGTVVFNDDTFGGWLLMEHPGVHGVIDSRTEIYPPAYWEDWIRARAGFDGWQGFLTRTGATAALLREGTPLVALLEGSGWRVAGRADGAVLLTRGSQ